MENFDEHLDDADWLAGQLRLDWRERQFLTDAEAIGEEEKGATAKKSTAKVHTGGVLSRFASEATLRHLQSAGWIKSRQARKIDVEDDYRPVRGWMRLWPLHDILKAELVIALAEMGDLPLISLAKLLTELPASAKMAAVPDANIAEELSTNWEEVLLGEYGLTASDPDTQAEARALLTEKSEDVGTGPRSNDPTLILVDRRWLLSVNYYPDLPDWPDDPAPVAEVKTLRASNTDIKFFFRRSGRTQSAERREDDRRLEEARNAYEHPVSRLDLNLAEPLRRFIHRNQSIQG